MRKKIGECLIQAGLISETDLQIALAEHKRTGDRLGAVLVRMNLATEKQIAKALAHQLGFAYVNLAENPPDAPAVVKSSATPMTLATVGTIRSRSRKRSSPKPASIPVASMASGRALPKIAAAPGATAPSWKRSRRVIPIERWPRRTRRPPGWCRRRAAGRTPESTGLKHRSRAAPTMKCSSRCRG